MADEYSPLHDAEQQRYITPNPLESFHDVLVPVDLLRRGEPIDTRVYCEMVLLAKGQSGQVVELPDRFEMARRCGCGHFQYDQSIKRLHNIGWITITNLHERKKVRRRIVVKLLEPMIITKMALTELMERAATAFMTTPQVSLHKTEITEPTTLPPRLARIKQSCRKADKHGNTLAAVPDNELVTLSGGASWGEIEQAMIEVEQYNGATIHSITALYRNRFKSGKLNPDRKGIPPAGHAKAVTPSGVNHTRKNRVLVQQLEREGHSHASIALRLGANIYPDETHDHLQIDGVCNDLAHGDAVYRADLSASMIALNNPAAEYLIRGENDREQTVKLAPLAKLYKLASGYWLRRWEKPNNPDRLLFTRSTGQPRPLSEIVHTASSEN